MNFPASEYDKIVRDILNLACHYEQADVLTPANERQYDALMDAYEALTRDREPLSS